MKQLFYCLTLLFSISKTYSQGFDWQWSARLPFKNPNKYIGIIAKYGLEKLNGNISFLENKIQCENFANANGNKIILGLAYDYWTLNNRLCYSTQFFYSNSSLTSNNINFIPISPTLTGKYETTLNINANYIGAAFAMKYRIPTTHLKTGAAIALYTLINNSYYVMEKILGPTEMPPFSTNPPSYSRNVIASTINELSVVSIMPEFIISYDLQLGLGTYFEPQISFGYQLNNKFKNDKTNNWNFTMGINVYLKIK